MKNLISVLFVTILLSLLTQFAVAQEKGDIAVGAGVAYGFDVEEIGIQVNGYYTLNEKMRVGADFIYWLTGDDVIDLTMWEFNGNFHYLFYNKNSLLLYGLGSLGYHQVKTSYYDQSVSDSEIGFGIGAGLEYDLGSVKLYAEPRIFLSGFDQFAISAGVRIPL
jgi:opacity protein-like surface antigen